MNKKVILIICFLLFGLSFFLRYSSHLDTEIKEGRQTLALQTIGSGADHDYQIKCGYLYSQNLPNEAITHYDYFFLCPGLGLVFANFPFVQGMELINFFLILSGSLVTVFPYLFLQYREKGFSVGGLFASLMLIVNQVMINNADGRFFIYPLVSLFFVFYLFAFFESLKKKSVFWLFSFGVMAFLHGINKPFMYANDIPLMVIYPILFLTREFKFIEKRPFLIWKISKEKAEWLKSIIPSVTYFISIVVFEKIYNLITGGYFFLTDLFIDTGGPTTKDAVLSNTIGYEGPKLQFAKNIVSATFMAIKELVEVMPWLDFILIGVIVLLVVRQKKPWLWSVFAIVSLEVLTFFIEWLVRVFIYPNVYVQIPILDLYQSWQIATVIFFFVLLSMQSAFLLAVVSVHAFYYGALAMTLPSVDQPQLFVTIIIWLTISIGLAIDHSLSFVASRAAKRVIFSLTLVVFLLFTPYVRELTAAATSSFNNYQQEKQYLAWVDETIPERSYILGGADDDLLLLSKYLDRTVIYSAFHVSSIFEPGTSAKDVYEFPSMPRFVKGKITSSEKSSLFVLDQGIERWQDYLATGKTETYPPGKYKLTEFAHNSDLDRSIYMLTLAE